MDNRIPSETKSLLEKWGYTVLETNEGKTRLYFEDSTIVGSVYFLESSESLESEWEKMQEQFFTRYAPNLRNAGQKSLNVNLVFLISEEIASSIVESLEYNFVASRKIVRSGITLGTLEQALTPLAPILATGTFAVEDPVQILRENLRFSNNEMEAMVENDPDRLIRLKLETLRNEN